MVAFKWEAPTDDGGSSVIDYNIEMAEDGESNDTVFTQIATGQKQTSYQYDTSIISQQTYQFRVSARNEFGYGDYSDPVKIVAA